MNIKEALDRYCKVTDWHEAAHHVDYSMEVEGDTCYLYLQGSDELIDWRRDLELWPRWAGGGCYVHSGCFASYCDLWNLGVIGSSYKHFVVIGYSSGGAMALLLALFEPETIGQLEVFTFAAPRVFWGKRPVFNTNTTVTSVRLAHDIVPLLFAPFGYRSNSDVVLKNKNLSPIYSHQISSYQEALQ